MPLGNGSKGSTEMIGAFILNARTGRLHRYPANEACNTDAIPPQYRLIDTDTRSIVHHKAYRQWCLRCQKEINARATDHAEPGAAVTGGSRSGATRPTPIRSTGAG